MAADRNDHRWVGDSDALLDRLRPVRLRYDLAIVGASIILAAAAVCSAYLLAPALLRFDMTNENGVIYVLDRRSGAVAACKDTPSGMLCTEDDSAVSALRRRLRAEDSP